MLYCLDSNVFIQGWNEYYSPDFTNGYWEILENLFKNGVLIISEMVKKEIDKTEDDLQKWFDSRQIPIIEIDGQITKFLKAIYDKDESHKRLVDSVKGRSEADPWVIATAMSLGATVVTKELGNLDLASKRIRIPNVCKNMEIRCINDFQLIKELNINISFEIG